MRKVPQNYDGNTYWVMPRCSIFFVKSRGASRNLVIWPTYRDCETLGSSEIYNIKTLCNYEIINNLFVKKKLYL